MMAELHDVVEIRVRVPLTHGLHLALHRQLNESCVGEHSDFKLLEILCADLGQDASIPGLSFKNVTYGLGQVLVIISIGEAKIATAHVNLILKTVKIEAHSVVVFGKQLYLTLKVETEATLKPLGNYTLVEQGTVAEYNGKFFGITYKDAQCTVGGYTTVDRATVITGDDVKLADFKPFQDRACPELEKATLRKIRITKTYELID